MRARATRRAPKPWRPAISQRSSNASSTIEPRTYEQIADLAFEYKSGARSLRGIFEEMMTPILYEIPDRRDIEKVVVTSLFTEATFVTRKSAP